MKRILIFSGTTEGRQLADILDASGICADVCVATGYGHEVMTEGQYRNIYTGRLTEEEMKEFMQKGDYAAIVDATHPYAVVVSSNIRQASAQAGLPYYRLRRTLQSAGDDSDVIYVKSQQILRYIVITWMYRSFWTDLKCGNMQTGQIWR